MYIYLTVSIFVSGLFVLENMRYIAERKRIWLAYTVLVFFFFLSCIRWETGTDWEPYFQHFYDINSVKSAWIGDFEAGYRIIVYLIRQFTDDFAVVNTFWAVVILVCQIYMVKYASAGLVKESGQQENRSLYGYGCPLSVICCLWFLYFGNIFPVRSTVAVCIQFIALISAGQGKAKRFLCLVLLAFSLHRTSILFLIVYPVYHCRKLIFSKFYLVSIGMSAVLFCCGRSVLMNVSVFLPESIQYKVDYYLSNPVFYGKWGFVNYILLLVFFLFLQACCCPYNREFRSLVNVYSIAMVPYTMGITVSGDFIRAAYPFMMAAVLLIPKTVQLFRKNSGRFAVILICNCYLAMRFLSNLNSWDVYVPFKTIFSR